MSPYGFVEASESDIALAKEWLATCRFIEKRNGSGQMLEARVPGDADNLANARLHLEVLRQEPSSPYVRLDEQNFTSEGFALRTLLGSTQVIQQWREEQGIDIKDALSQRAEMTAAYAKEATRELTRV